jgi:transcription elongation GreA/GreB family factor
MSIEPIGMG